MRVLCGRVYNYRSIEDLQLEFDESGIHALLGAPGSGKSSFLGAFGYALYGDPGTGIDLIDLRYDKADDSVPAGADFTWAHGQDTYRTLREMRRATRGGKTTEKTIARMWHNGTELDGITPTLMTKEVTRILGMGARAFRGANMIAQGEVDTLATATPTEVAELVEEHTGIAPLTKLRETARKAASTAQSAADAIVGNPEDVDRTEANEKEAQAAADAADADYRVATERATRAQAEWRALDQQSTDLRAAERLAANSRNAVVAAQGVAAAAQDRLSAATATARGLDATVDLAELEDQRDRLQELMSTLAAAGGAARKAAADADAAQAAARDAATAADTYDRAAAVAQIDEATTRRAAAEQDGRAADREQAARRAEATRLDKAVATLREAVGEAHCPTCQQQLADVARTTEDLVAQRDAALAAANDAHGRTVAARALFDEAGAAIIAGERTLRSIESAREHADRLRAAADLTAHDLTVAEATLRETVAAAGGNASAAAGDLLDAAIGAHAKVRESLDVVGAKVGAVNEVSAANGALQRAQQQVETATAAVVDAPAPEDVALAEEATATARAHLDDANRTASDAQAMRSATQTGLLQVTNDADIARDQWRRKQAALLEAEKARGVADTVAALRQDLLADYTRRISESASELLQRFGGEQVAFHLDSDFVPRIELADGRMRKTKLLSGGEKARAGLAFRLGISMQLTDGGLPDQIFGDEVTQYLDDAGRRAVVETIGDLFTAPILVSHTDEILDYATTVHTLHRNPLGATEIADIAA